MSKRLVTVTVAAEPDGIATMPSAGARVVCVARPASVSSTEQEAPAIRSSIVAVYPFAFESVSVAFFPRSIGVVTPSTR